MVFILLKDKVTESFASTEYCQEFFFFFFWEEISTFVFSKIVIEKKKKKKKTALNESMYQSDEYIHAAIIKY